MNNAIHFNAIKKEEIGTGNSRKVRNSGMVPAIVYGGKHGNTMLSISLNEFQKEYRKGSIKTRLVELVLEDKKDKLTAIIRDIQLHPVSDKPIHIDFQEVDANTMIKVSIAVRVINEDKCPGIRRGGVVNLVYRAIPIWCNPYSIPDHIDIDVSGMEIGQNKHISDISLPENVKPVDKSNFTMLSIGGALVEEEAKEISQAAAEAPVAGAAAAK